MSDVDGNILRVIRCFQTRAGFRELHFRRDEKIRMLSRGDSFAAARKPASCDQVFLRDHPPPKNAAGDAEDAIDNPSAVVL